MFSSGLPARPPHLPVGALEASVPPTRGGRTGGRLSIFGDLDTEATESELIRDEGIRLKPYVDCCGRDWRACVAVPCASAAKGHRGKLTIGIGHNLDDNGLTRAQINHVYDDDMIDVVTQLKIALPWWPALDGVRKRVLANMAFNFGPAHLLSEFAATIKLIADGDYKTAASHMRNSLWAKQVGVRAERLAKMMESGESV